MATVQRPRVRRLQDRVRIFNKWILNPFTLRFAGRPGSPYGVVRHVGRRSGQVYDTPVLVGTTDEHVVVPLPYGDGVDWCRNVRAAGECTVAVNGRAYRADDPELVPLDAAHDVFPGWVQRMVADAGAEHYLRLDRGEPVPEAYDAITHDHPFRPILATLGALVLVALLRRVAGRGGGGEGAVEETGQAEPDADSTRLKAEVKKFR